ncbi:hypothetical protein GCM10027580_25800 [Corynebacterium faecale]
MLAAAALLAGCSGENADEQAADTPTESITVTTSETPTFEPQQVETVILEDGEDSAEDPGLNIRVHFQGTGFGTNGGSVVYVAVTNLNEIPLPTDAIEQPTLRIVDYNGELMDIEPIDGDDNIPLDLPLGVGATTNLQWAYNTSNGSLWAAQFEIGNLLFDGNLNNL